MPKHHKETLTFDCFCGSGYYGALSSQDGYGGFNYADDCEYVSATYWEKIETNWCDNGYTNVAAASGGPCPGSVYIYDVGLMESADLKETFSLISMIAASAWDTNAVWDVKSYTYSHGSLTLKASDTMTLSQTATKIDFAELGQKGDFKNISAVFFELSSQGSGGNTCSYGAVTYGYQLCLNALKVCWNGKIPTDHGKHKVVLPPGLANHHHLNAHPWAHEQHGHANADAGVANHAAAHNADTAYHSQLLSLSGQEPGSLIAQFHLPSVEHFGS